MNIIIVVLLAYLKYMISIAMLCQLFCGDDQSRINNDVGIH